jgi:polysaccharide export outer membrane protein
MLIISKRIANTIFATIVFIILISCNTKEVSTKVPPIVDLHNQRNVERFNEAITNFTISNNVLNDDYRIGPEDLLEIDAYNVEDIKKTVRVNSSGEIALPLIGIINVKGMTTSELERLITEKLNKYVQETVVNVSIKEYRNQRVSVIGAVNNPQIYSVTGQRYLIDMLMMAGGLKEEAGNICYVIRPRQSKDMTMKSDMIVIDLEELLVKGNLSLNIPILAGDVINVPRGGVVFIDGAVTNPGVYPLKLGTTLIQAIAMAKGVRSDAKLSEVKIFRDNGKGEREAIEVDYEAISKGEKSDIRIAENDIIIVPKSGFKSIISSLRGLFTFGSGSVGLGM